MLFVMKISFRVQQKIYEMQNFSRAFRIKNYDYLSDVTDVNVVCFQKELGTFMILFYSNESFKLFQFFIQLIHNSQFNF